MRKGLVGSAVAAFSSLLMACTPGADAVLTPWDEVTVGPSDDILTVGYPGSECATFGHVEVAESPEAVSVYVYERAPRGTTACSAVAIIREAVIRLRQPLAGREVTGCTVPVAVPCDEPPADSYTAEVIEVHGDED